MLDGVLSNTLIRVSAGQRMSQLQWLVGVQSLPGPYCGSDTLGTPLPISLKWLWSVPTKRCGTLTRSKSLTLSLGETCLLLIWVRVINLSWSYVVAKRKRLPCCSIKILSS